MRLFDLLGIPTGHLKGRKGVIPEMYGALG